jgi:hypothetical protein
MVDHFGGDCEIPPWLTIAWQEHKKYKGLKETQEPLATAIKGYFNLTNSKGSGANDPWCAAFVNWCVIESGYISSSSYTAKAYAWGPNEVDEWYKGWPEGEVYKSEVKNKRGKAFVGAIAVFNFSHCAFVIGKTKNGKIVALGGNQGSYYLNVTIVGESRVLYYMKPKDYFVPAQLENLPVLSVSGGEMSYENTR